MFGDARLLLLWSGPSCVLLCVFPVLTHFWNFSRLTTWAHTSHNIPEEHLLHLQVGLYSLFHRLYSMYPCNFLSYLRSTFGNGDRRVVFTNTIKPMLETVKMHPMLVTASKEGELSPLRWKNKEYDEIMAECALVSLDVLESGLPEELNPIQLRARISTSHVPDPPSSELSSTQLLRVPASSLIQQSIKPEITDLSSLATHIEDSAPPTPSSFVTSTTTHPYIGTAQLSTTEHKVIVKSAVSPPETAMEATPENTPMQTPVKDRHTTHFKLPTSPAVKHLNFGKQTPPSSIPSSPAPHTADTMRRDSIFDTNVLRRDSLLMGRLEKIMVEQQHGGNGNQLKEEPLRRPLPLNLTECSTSSGVIAGVGVLTTLDPTTGSTGGDIVIGGGPFTPMLCSFPPVDSHVENLEDSSDMDEMMNETVPMPDPK